MRFFTILWKRTTKDFKKAQKEQEKKLIIFVITPIVVLHA